MLRHRYCRVYCEAIPPPWPSKMPKKMNDRSMIVWMGDDNDGWWWTIAYSSSMYFRPPWWLDTDTRRRIDAADVAGLSGDGVTACSG